MQVSVAKEIFLSALQLVEKISGKHVTLPVLQGIYLEAKEGELLIRATNLDVGLEYRIAATVTTPGVVVVPAAVLVQVVGSLAKGGVVSLTQAEGGLEIKAGNSISHVKCLNHEEFPYLPKIEDSTQSFVLDPQVLVSGIRAVWYSASTSTIKPELASVYVYERAGNVVFVATDSFRLAEKQIKPKEVAQFESFLLPIRNTVDLVRVLETLTEPVSIVANQNQLSISTESVYFTTRLTDGSFPDYEQIVPTEFATTLVVLKADLQTVLKKTTIFTNNFSQVTFSIEPKKKKITVRAASNEIGDMEDVLDGTIEGEDLEIRFNQKYLSDCFQSIPSDSVTLSFSGVGRPVIIKGVSDDSFYYLAMPMNK